MPERMFTPWRMRYIEGARDGGDGCVFCDIWASDDDESALVLLRGTTAFVVMNLYPYTTGHLLVAPIRHTGDVAELTPDELLEMGSLIQRCVGVLEAEMSPDGFNVGMNLGRVAGAGVPGHVHWHVVPRWSGDSNFMPVVGETRMIPEDLGETYRRLRPHF